MFTNNTTKHKKAHWKVPNSFLSKLSAVLAVVVLALFVARPAQAATTVINVCSQNGTYQYNILGTNAQGLRAKLDNLANFGPTGAYGDYDFVYINVGDNFTQQTILNNLCDIWFSGYESDGTYTSTELTQLQNWVANHNGQVIAGCDAATHDPVCNLLNFTVTTDTDSYGFITNTAVNPINCDGSLGPGDRLEMAGGAGGYFSGTGVAASNVLAVHETNGTPNPAKPIVVYTGNFFFTADIDMITTVTLSAGGGVTNNNDILAMNAFSALADVAVGVAVCSSAAPDSDNDGVVDPYDAFPLDPNESVDTDGDGIGNDADPDDDNDGQSDSNEIACGSNPLDANSTSPDSDGDNIPDCVDTVGPTLYVADANLDAASGSISVPVLFTSNGSSIASVGFSLDYQESCLSYSSVSGVPAGFIDSITHEAADTDGELDISVYDASTPVDTLPDGTLLTVVFTVKAACITTDGTTTAVTVNFSSNPAASFGDPSATDVTGTTSGGTLTLRFNAPPTDISLSPSSIAENAASGTTVGALSTTDADAGNSHTYALVTGTGSDDNASFTLDGNSLKSAAVFDFESKSSYSVRLRSTDNGGLSFEKALTVAVTDLYEAPTGSSFGAPGGGDDGNPNTLDLNENKAAGASVATFAAANPNTGSSYTFALVAGAGCPDNGSFTFVGNELQTTAPLDAEKPGGYTICVVITDQQGNSATQILTVIVNSVNEAPIAVDDAVDPRTTVLVGAAAHTIAVLANDSDPDVGNTLTVAALTQPAAGTATNNSSHISFSAPNANGTASFTYQATDGALTSANATVTVNHVKSDPRGDCNSNGSVTAADFIATVLEIFDAASDPLHEGNPAWWRIYAGGYAGSPLGCDANASQNGASHSTDSVTAADIICTVRVFFGDSSCTQPVVAAASALSTATLRAPQAQAAQAGSTTNVAVTLETAGHAVAAAAFVLTLDPQVVSLDLTDADGNGVPDAVQINAPASMSRSVTWNTATHRLEVALFGAALPLPTLADGPLVTVTLNVAPTAPTGSTPLPLAQVSLGNTEGQDITVTDVDGSLTIGSPSEGAMRAYLPFIIR